MADKVKEHTTNYFDTFIEVAEDTKANKATKPISKGDKKSIGEMQYDLIDENDMIEETLFFYPLVGMLKDLTDAIYNKKTY